MATLAEIHRAALELSGDERTILMTALWESLPQSEAEDPLLEQRQKELAADPASEISHAELLSEVKKNRSSTR